MTLVAATLVLVARTGAPTHPLIALVPTLLFLFLDSYYLALERAVRVSYCTFVDKLHKGELRVGDVYVVPPPNVELGKTLHCLLSPSIWLFYLLLIVTILLAWWLVIPSEITHTNGGM